MNYKEKQQNWALINHSCRRYAARSRDAINRVSTDFLQTETGLAPFSSIKAKLVANPSIENSQHLILYFASSSFEYEK